MYFLAAKATLPLNVNTSWMSLAHAYLKAGTPFSLLENSDDITHTNPQRATLPATISIDLFTHHTR